MDCTFWWMPYVLAHTSKTSNREILSRVKLLMWNDSVNLKLKPISQHAFCAVNFITSPRDPKRSSVATFLSIEFAIKRQHQVLQNWPCVSTVAMFKTFQLFHSRHAVSNDHYQPRSQALSSPGPRPRRKTLVQAGHVSARIWPVAKKETKGGAVKSEIYFTLSTGERKIWI